MSKENKKTMTPKLRFPEFREAGEWEEKSLGDALSSESSLLAQGKLQFVKNGYPVYGAEGLLGFTSSFSQKDDYIAIIKDGSGAGKLFLYKKQSSVIGTLTYLNTKNSIKFNLNWLFYLLHTIDFSSYVKGSGIPHIYFSDYSKQVVAFPSPPEQQKIAATLSSLDALIAAQSEKIKALQDHKKGLMQRLFPAEGERVPRVRFGEFRESGEWEESQLGEKTIKVGSGITPKGGDKTYKNVGRPFVRSQNVGWGCLILEDIAFIDEATHSTFLSTEIKEGDILLNITGASIGRSAIADTRIKGGNVNQHVCIIRTKKELSSFFLNQYLLSNFGQKQIDSFQAGGNRQGLNFAQIRSLLIPLPPTFAEQQKIAATLSSLDDLIAAQNEKLEALKAHKKGLMQGLFPNPGAV